MDYIRNFSGFTTSLTPKFCELPGTSVSKRILYLPPQTNVLHFSFLEKMLTVTIILPLKAGQTVY